MAKRYLFFLTKSDLMEILQDVEKEISLQYIKGGSYSSNDLEEYDSLLEYKELGINKTGNHLGESFVVIEKSNKLVTRMVKLADDSIRYFVDQKENPDSIMLRPGGIFEEGYLICGEIGTISSSEASIRIFKVFQKYIKRRCKTTVGRFHVSEEAKKMYGTRRFITISVKQAMEYDLKL